MAKLKLNVEALEVQSFLTTDEQARSPGTVEGHDSGRTPSLTRQQSCPGFEATCPATCDDYTCGGTCYDTCDYTCQTNCACGPDYISEFGSCPPC